MDNITLVPSLPHYIFPWTKSRLGRHGSASEVFTVTTCEKLIPCPQSRVACVPATVLLRSVGSCVRIVVVVDSTPVSLSLCTAVRFSRRWVVESQVLPGEEAGAFVGN